MGKGGGRGGIRQIVRRHIHGLDRGDGSLPRGGNPLFQGSHLFCQRWLVPHSGRHTPQKSRHLGTRLGKTENIVNKKKHILMFYIPKIFRHGKPRESGPHAGSGRLIHLAVDQSGLFNHAALLHLTVEVISLTRALPHSRKHRKSAVGRGDIVNELHDENGFSHSRTSEKADLSSLHIGTDQIHNFDSRLQNLRRRRLLPVGRRLPVDRPPLGCFRRRQSVCRLSQDIEHPAQAGIPHRNRNRSAGIHCLNSPDQAFRRSHGNAPYQVIPDLLGRLRHQRAALFPYLDGI